jgi:hypothetical protein
MPPVKRFFVISYNLIFNCRERKIIPIILQGIHGIHELMNQHNSLYIIIL